MHTVTRPSSIDTFSDLCRPIVGDGTHHDKEWSNILLLRIINSIKAGDYPEHHLFAVVNEAGLTVLAAVMTPPHNLTFSAGPQEAVDILIRHLLADRVPFPGINGPKEVTDYFAAAWNQASPASLAPAITLPFYIIQKTTPTARSVTGRMRLAVDRDLDLLTKWRSDFAIEAGLHIAEQKLDPDKTAKRIRENRFYIWENDDHQPVSFAGHAKATAHGFTVGPVYTPSLFRGHGYATACVAALSQQILDQGAWCGLFADAANPTSNAIYQKIGYKHFCTYQEYRIKE